MPDRASCPTCHAVFRGGFQRCPQDGAELAHDGIDPLVGTVLAERYQIESVIGEGGIGRVYRARHVRMSRRYAIKVPFGELAYDTKVRARFLQEAEATSRLQHPNVIGVVDVGETAAGLLYMAMDLAEGTSLAEVIHQQGPLAPSRVLRIAEQMAEGLGHAHERGLVHRDLKPENVILEREGTPDERVRIVDFGIAILRDADGNSGRLTTEGIVLGTPHYMSPEQACNLEIDNRTDLFALGLIIYEMLAGVLPFDGTPVEVARKNLGAQPPRITQRVAGLVPDPHLQALAFWLMEKRPEARPQRAVEVVEVLRLIARDPAGAAARLRMGEVDEVEMGLAPVIADLPAPRAATARPPTVPAVPRVGPPIDEALAAGSTAPAPAPPPPRVEIHTDRQEPARRAPVFAIVLGLLLFGTAALVVSLLVLPPRSPGVAIPPDATPAPVEIVAIPPDAAPPPLDVTDAAAEPPPPDAAAAATTKRPRRDAGVAIAAPRPDAPPRAPVDAAAPAEPPTAKTLTSLYEQVGGQLAALVRERGEESALALTRRYQAIPYLEAVRKASLRAEAIEQLRALSRDVRRARQQ